MAKTTPITRSAEWTALVEHRRLFDGLTLRSLFAEDPQRGGRLTVEAGELYLDFSKQRVTDRTLELLTALASTAGLADRIEAMFSGERINTTEDRAALHTALRRPATDSLFVDGTDVVAENQALLERMAGFAAAVRLGHWRGHTGKPISTLVNIGIGGSDLGPSMAYEALRPFSQRSLSVKFVSNVDGADIDEVLRTIEPATTLFAISSKTFTTLETMTNAATARHFIIDKLGADAVSKHFVAVSTNRGEVTRFGIDPQNMFEFRDWVGGRYSVDSAIGLSLVLAIGPEGFREFLGGFHDIDQHFRHAPLDRNAPVLLALLGIWYGDFFGAQSHAVIPYSQRLAQFPAYLQQLEMESNGKSVALDGTPLDVQTSPIVWGSAGTNGQHAYFQLLHQGTPLVPVDFIGFAEPNGEPDHHHDLLIANMFAQAEALAFGKTADEVRNDGVAERLVAHKVFPGDRPSTTILGSKLTPRALGQLVSLYEHKVFTQGVIWNVNSFDQWGVELGKVLAGRIVGELQDEARPRLDHDRSTNELIERYRRLRGRA